MFHAIIATQLAAAVVLLASSLAALSAEQWKLCRHPGATFTCGTAPCIYIVASFPTNEECVVAKNSKNFPASRSKNSGKAAKPAGAAGLAECRKRYGKSVTSAEITQDGRLNCYSSSNDPIVVREQCKKRFGPMSQTVRHRGQWYCTQR
jgi:hypothetical protein